MGPTYCTGLMILRVYRPLPPQFRLKLSFLPGIMNVQGRFDSICITIALCYVFLIQCVTKSHKGLVATSLRRNMSPSRHNLSGTCDDTVERDNGEAGLFGKIA